MTRPAHGRCLVLLVTTLVGSLLTGCVERTLIIRTEPPGAKLVVNGQPAGASPVKLPFDTYGTFDVVASVQGHHRLNRMVPVKPPWYEQIPIDFLVENVWPFTVRDVHEATLKLRPITSADDESIDQRERELRERLRRSAQP